MTAPRPHLSLRSLRDRWHVVATRRKTPALQVFPGMQMAPRRMVICRLIRPASRPKTPRNYSHSRAERVCRTVRRKSRLGSYDNCLSWTRESDFKIFIPRERNSLFSREMDSQSSSDLLFDISLLEYLMMTRYYKDYLLRKSQSESINKHTIESCSKTFCINDMDLRYSILRQ